MGGALTNADIDGGGGEGAFEKGEGDPNEEGGKRLRV